MKDEERAVGRHYDQNVLAYEQDRLELHCPVEFALTLRALSRFMPHSAKVAVDIGVGSGAYSLWLARGIDVHLVGPTVDGLSLNGDQSQSFPFIFICSSFVLRGQSGV